MGVRIKVIGHGVRNLCRVGQQAVGDACEGGVLPLRLPLPRVDMLDKLSSKLSWHYADEFQVLFYVRALVPRVEYRGRSSRRSLAREAVHPVSAYQALQPLQEQASPRHCKTLIPLVMPLPAPLMQAGRG